VRQNNANEQNPDINRNTARKKSAKSTTQLLTLTKPIGIFPLTDTRFESQVIPKLLVAKHVSFYLTTLRYKPLTIPKSMLFEIKCESKLAGISYTSVAKYPFLAVWDNRQYAQKRH
jgi:hypothetical protein